MLLSCTLCGVNFKCHKSRYLKKLSTGQVNFYCSNTCAAKHRSENSDIITKCKKCNIEIKQKKHAKKLFCSSSCAASYNNKNRTTNKKILLCLLCDAPVYAKTKTRCCKKCAPTVLFKGKANIRNLTKKDLVSKFGKTSANNMIRADARKLIKESNIQRACRVCNYNKYTEIAHIKAVYLFEESTKISTINDINNIVVLCPTHHKELDRNIMEDDDFSKILEKALPNEL